MATIYTPVIFWLSFQMSDELAAQLPSVEKMFVLWTVQMDADGQMDTDWVEMEDVR